MLENVSCMEYMIELHGELMYLAIFGKRTECSTAIDWSLTVTCGRRADRKGIDDIGRCDGDYQAKACLVGVGGRNCQGRCEDIMQ